MIGFLALDGREKEAGHNKYGEGVPSLRGHIIHTCPFFCSIIGIFFLFVQVCGTILCKETTVAKC